MQAQIDEQHGFLNDFVDRYRDLRMQRDEINLTISELTQNMMNRDRLTSLTGPLNVAARCQKGTITTEAICPGQDKMTCIGLSSRAPNGVERRACKPSKEIRISLDYSNYKGIRMCYPNAIDAIKYNVNGTITFTGVMIGFLVLLVWTLACLYINYKLTRYSFRSKIKKY